MIRKEMMVVRKEEFMMGGKKEEEVVSVVGEEGLEVEVAEEEEEKVEVNMEVITKGLSFRPEEKVGVMDNEISPEEVVRQ